MNYDFSKIEKFFNLKNPNMVILQKDYLSFNTGIYGNSQDNAMPQFLIDLQGYSAIHQNFINLKKALILGDNLSAANVNDETQISQFIKAINKIGDNWKSIYNKCSTDYSIFEGAYLQVLYDRTGKIAEIYHVPYQDVRIGKPDVMGNITHYYISKNWANISNYRYKKINTSNSAVKIPAFNPKKWKDEPVQLIMMKKYSPSTYYPIPSYLSAIMWILIDYEIAKFHLNNTRNNFFINGMLTMVGDPTDEEKQKFIQDFKELYMGTGDLQKAVNTMLFSWVDDMANQKPEFTAFQSDKNDKLFEVLMDKARSSIIAGHNGREGLIFEGKGADLGGDANKLFTELQYFTQTVTENMKETLLGGFNQVTALNGYPELDVVTEPLKLTLPIAQAEDLTRDERREILYGLPPINNNEENIPQQ